MVHPSFKRVKDYHYNTCISVNDVAVHGILMIFLLREVIWYLLILGLYIKGCIQIVVGHGV